MRALWMAVAVVCMGTLCSAGGGLHLDTMWENFKRVHKKQYKSAEEEDIRRYHWEKNVEYIQMHNLQYDLGIHTFTVGINEYSDWSPKEYNMHLNGYRPRPHKPSNSSKLIYGWKASVEGLPDTVDWRAQGYVTPIKNQGGCGSCWAFSSTGALEGQMFRSTGQLRSLSEQQLVDCDKKNGGCNGGWMNNAFDYVKENGGIDSEECYNYTGQVGQCLYKPSCAVGHCTGHVDVAQGSEQDLQRAVATVGPVSVAIDANHQSFMQYKSGIFDEPACDPVKTDHAVLVVGYGTENTKDYWLVKNSWGTSWGMEGYIKMRRNKNNMCGIASYATYPLA